MAVYICILWFSFLISTGRGLGMIIGGVIYNQYGSRNMFRSFAVYCGVVLIVLWLVQIYIWRTTRQQTLSVQYDEI